MEFSQAQKNKIKELAKQFKLKLVLLFGSGVSKEMGQESDVDFAVLGEKDLSFEEKIILNTKLSGLFRDEKIIDLVDLKKANPLLKQEVAKNCILLYGKEEDFFEFTAQAFKEYIDHLPLLELEDFLIKKRQKLFTESIARYGE